LDPERRTLPGPRRHTRSSFSRLLAATNRNLTRMMGDRLFRSDLDYRLKVISRKDL
jgi:transcriptional regulator with GAF, ATPase, and Fis domain